MKNNKEKLRKYKELRLKYYARTLVPRCKGTAMDQMRATFRSLDMTEDFIRFMAMNEEVPMPVQEAYIQRVYRTRQLAQVNERAEKLWKIYRKVWTFGGEFKALGLRP